MHHATPLITTIVGGLVLAFIFGMIASKLRISPLVGYLLAGVLAGPFTPGFVADTKLASELAELGVILLMFGVGLHFSLKDLIAVKSIAITGAIAQIIVATLLGIALSIMLNWSLMTGIVFGLCLSTASTVVLLRALEERKLIDSKCRQIAIGWLIVEDLVMVLTLVLLPAIANMVGKKNIGFISLALSISTTIGKVVAFIIIMMLAGRHLVLWLMSHSSATGSRELFTLSVLALALGVAFGAVELFDVSFALGAFFAGMVLNESELSHRAAHDTLPLRDAFAVLFFVSVGMLFDPMTLVEQPLTVLGTLAIIIIGKLAAAFLLVRLFGYSSRTALIIAASLALIGEFAFILAGLGTALNLLPQTGHNLVLAGAILSIMLNPVLFVLLEKYFKKSKIFVEQIRREFTEKEKQKIPVDICNHALLVGFGRVGTLLVEKLIILGIPLAVIEILRNRIEELHELGIYTIIGDATNEEIMKSANLDCARWLLLTITSNNEIELITAFVRKKHPNIKIITHPHCDEKVKYITKYSADLTVMGEKEIVNEMLMLMKKSSARNAVVTR